MSIDTNDNLFAAQYWKKKSRKSNISSELNTSVMNSDSNKYT
jgi:hypothetical protein